MKTLLVARRGVWLFVATSICSAQVAIGQELDAMLSAWRERTTATRAVSLTWEGEYVLAETIDVGTGSSTSRPQSFTFQARLKFRGEDGDEVHYWSSVPMRNGETGGVTGSDSTIVVNGGRLTTISKLEPASHYDAAHVDSGDGADMVWNNLDMIPIILCWRSLTPGMFGYASEQIRMTDERGDTDDCKDCRILETRDSNGQRRNEFWVANSPGFPIVRHRVLSSDGSLFWQTDMSYHRDSGGNLVPASWQRVSPEKKRVWGSTIKVTRVVAEINAGVADADFEVTTFPRQTLYMDETKNRWLFDDVGAKKPITEAQWTKLWRQSYSDVFPGMRVQRPERTAWWTYGSLIAACSLGVLVVLFRLYWRSRS